MREFDFIKNIRKAVTPVNNPVIRSIGDDCAILPYTKQKDLLISSDSLYEGVHFKKSYFRPWEIGARAVSVNISDICAMGGTPRYCLVNIGFPEGEKQGFIDKIYRGIMDFASNYSVDIIGGDTISADRVFISITILGDVEKGRAMRRDGAKPGDLVFVTGFLGDSYAGLKVLSRKARKNLLDHEIMPVKKHLVPVPAYAAGRMLLESRAASSCIDVSDGLVNDLTRVCEESGVGADIVAEDLPVSPSCVKTAKLRHDNPVDYALYGGEDYELLFTVPRGKLREFDGYLKKNCMAVFGVGRINAKKGLYIVRKGNRKKAGYKKAWKHF